MSMMSLPLGWKSAKLGDIAQMVMGQSPPSDTYNENRIGLPFLQGKADFTESFPKPTKWCTMPLKIAPKGSVLISVRAPVGDVNLADQEYIIGRGLSSISIDNGDNGFLFYSLIHNKNRINAQGSGTTFQSINKSTLESFSILLPPLPEQRAIAHALHAVQGAREARLREVALERERKAALMEHLFTKGTRGEATKQTEIGETPESWKVVTLGDRSFKPDYGYTASASKNPSGPKFLRITDIQEDHVNWDSVPYCDKCQDIEENYKLKSGDLVIARIGATTGKIYLIHDCPDAIFASYLIRVRTRPGLSPDFLYFYCQTKNYWEHINQNKGCRLKGGVNIPILQRLPLPFPAVSEQDSISKVLLACDSKIAALEHEARLLEELFRAMLEELMNGRLPAGALVKEAA